MEECDLDEIIEEFVANTKNAKKVQEDTLKKILERNGSAEYLQKHGLDSRTDVASFRACVPVVGHEDLEPVMRRIADGDPVPILTTAPITTLSWSSGTTRGKPKMVPFNDELLDTTLKIYKTSFAFRNKEFPVQKGKVLNFFHSSNPGSTRGGLVTGTATTNVFLSPQFSTAMDALGLQSCSPQELAFGGDFHQSMYCQLLCGLIFREDIQIVSSTFGHSIVMAFGEFEQSWEELCDDIDNGVISKRIKDKAMAEAMNKLLKPNPELSNLVRGKCAGLSNWHGLVSRIFPNARYIYGIMTGSMEHYVSKIRHYAGDVPVVCADYGSSEGWIGANVHPRLAPDLVTFTVLPDIGYFEFIPTRDEAKSGSNVPVCLTEVQVGGLYEIALTNVAGLYRYRVGDVVKVTGFFNDVPRLKFMYRKNLLLSINIDKTTECDLQRAIQEASKRLDDEKLELVDFSSTADVSTDPGHYVVFWELSGEANGNLMQACCNSLDRSFVDPGYVGSRKINAIGALELKIVKSGTFRKILEFHMGLGSSASQFKTPRCIGPSNKHVLQILRESVNASYYSTSFE